MELTDPSLLETRAFIFLLVENGKRVKQPLTLLTRPMDRSSPVSQI